MSVFEVFSSVLFVTFLVD